MSLPYGWTSTRLADVSTISMGQSPDGEFTNSWGQGIPLIGGAADYHAGIINITRYTTEPKKICDAGDLILSIRATIGKLAVADKRYCIGRGVVSIKPHIHSKYLQYVLIKNAKRLDDLGVGSTFKQIDKKTIENLPIQLPPLDEQHRITAKLDTLLLRVENTSRVIAQLQSQIERYKELILDSAYTGNITEQWRVANYQNQTDISELKDAALAFDYGTSAKSSKHGKVPVLRMGNIQDGKIDLKNLVYTSDDKEIKKYLLNNGDVLFNRTNSPELVGKTAVFKEETPTIFAGYLIRVRCSERIFPDYLSYCINSPSGKAYCQKVKNDGISQSNINAKKLASFPIRIPSLEEQQIILNKIEVAFKLVDSAFHQIIIASSYLDFLRTTLIDNAITGKLSVQNPQDVDAHSLLQSISQRKIDSNHQSTSKSKISHTKKVEMKKLLEVLQEDPDWIDSQEVFRRCGIFQNATTEDIEPVYSQLRELGKLGRLEIQTVRDENGVKTGERLKLKDVTHAAV